jgi:hypothetical protein
MMVGSSMVLEHICKSLEANKYNSEVNYYVAGVDFKPLGYKVQLKI